jgi:hypothetical protein
MCQSSTRQTTLRQLSGVVIRSGVVLALALSGCSVAAQELSVYTGVAIGVFDHKNPDGGDFSDSVSSWKIYGGFQPVQYFGVEVAYGRTDAIEGGASGSPLSVGVRRFHVANRVDFTLTTLKAMGHLPFEWGALWFGYGQFRMNADAEFTLSPGDRRSMSVSDDGEMAALGIEWRLRRFDRSIDVRLEYEWLNFPFADASTIAIGVAYRFHRL